MHAMQVLKEYQHNSNRTLMTHPSTFTEGDLFAYKLEVQRHMETIWSSSSTSADAAASRPERARMLKSVHPDKTGQGSASGDDYHNAIRAWQTRADAPHAPPAVVVASGFAHRGEAAACCRGIHRSLRC